MSTETTDQASDVIDLTAHDDVSKVKVKIERHANPLDGLSEQERMRLFIRVLCELVAYGEVDEDTTANVA